MSARTAFFIFISSFIFGCVSNRDFVTVTPIFFIPVVGADGPQCQGWCPTSADQATKYRVEVGNKTFRTITDQAKSKGKDGDLAFLDFAKDEVAARGFCARAQLVAAHGKQPINSVEGWSAFWTDVSCGH